MSEEEVLERTLTWLMDAQYQINRAGGSYQVIDTFNRQTILTLIRNNLYLEYRKPNH